MCNVLNCKARPMANITLPELLLFIERVAERSRIDAITGIVALMYVYRLKVKLPPKAQGEYGTSHRIFLSSLLVASKFLYGKEGLNNRTMADVSGVFSTQEVCRMEKELLELLNYNVWVNDLDVKEFLEKYKAELCFM
ncbi:hypothetical protein K7432_014136 [Basidiobolus ranarum]|uniref:Cyclin N-terminal domain-containing protein n=1 Tax=Basidiobolus ranarum TaxID=34480 RepID=A0ABR2WI60_9FUNG